MFPERLLGPRARQRGEVEEEPRSPVCWWGAAECEPLLLPCPPSAPSYEVQLGDSVVSMSGCSLECWKDMVQKACCPGYWGSQCYGTGVPARLLTLSPAPVCGICPYSLPWACPRGRCCWAAGLLGSGMNQVFGGPQSALGVLRPHAMAVEPAWMGSTGTGPACAR